MSFLRNFFIFFVILFATLCEFYRIVRVFADETKVAYLHANKFKFKIEKSVIMGNNVIFVCVSFVRFFLHRILFIFEVLLWINLLYFYFSMYAGWLQRGLIHELYFFYNTKTLTTRKTVLFFCGWVSYKKSTCSALLTVITNGHNTSHWSGHAQNVNSD